MDENERFCWSLLRTYAEKLVAAVTGRTDLRVEVYPADKFASRYCRYELHANREWVFVVEGEIGRKAMRKLANVLDNMVHGFWDGCYWEEGRTTLEMSSSQSDSGYATIPENTLSAEELEEEMMAYLQEEAMRQKEYEERMWEEKSMEKDAECDIPEAFIDHDIPEELLDEWEPIIPPDVDLDCDEDGEEEESSESLLMGEPEIHDLPSWLDDFIFEKLDADYAPDHERYEYNLDLGAKELLTYLGTYFPRSFAESEALFEKLFARTRYEKLMKGKSRLDVLDLGCGSGGEIFGLLSFIEERMPGVKEVRVLAIDGNNGALRLFEQIMGEFKRHSRLHTEYQVGPVAISDEETLREVASLLGSRFDVILSFKAICELVAKRRITGNAYAFCAGMLAPFLSDCGVMLLVDVTIKKEAIGQFLPLYFNAGLNEFLRQSGGEFETILPAVCRGKVGRCTAGCFFKEEVCVQHSEKMYDWSKVVYRFVGRTAFVERLDAEVRNDRMFCKL